MGSSSSRAGAAGQPAKTILQTGGQAKPCRPSGSPARPGAAPPDETLSLLESAHVVDSENDDRRGAQLGRLTDAETGDNGEENSEKGRIRLEGTWYYYGTKYNLRAEPEGGLRFDERFDTGDVCGLLTSLGDWYQGTLFADQSQTEIGTIRLRLDEAHAVVVSNFMASGSTVWEADVVALKDPTYVTIDLSSPDEWNVLDIKKKMLAALKQSGLNRFDLDCFDFEAFDVNVGFDDLESINDQSGSTFTSEQVACSLEGDNMGVLFPLSARIKIRKASEDKPLTPMERAHIASHTSNVFGHDDELPASFTASVTLRRLLLPQQTVQCKRYLALTLHGFALRIDPAGRDALLAAGCARAVVRCMHEGDVETDSYGASFLDAVSAGSTERAEAIVDAGAGEVLPRILATDRFISGVSRLHCLSCIAALARGSAAAREAMENAGVVSALLKTAAHHSERFETCAVALSFYAGEVVEEKRAGLHLSELYELGEEGIRMDQVAAAADGIRYGWFSLAKDSLLPLFDVCLDVVNAYTLFVEGHYMWLAAQVAALAFNGCASALHAAAGGHWVTAAVDLLTFGTAGLVKESHLCFKQGVKSESLITLKLIEACEAGVSLAVTADTIVAAGTLPGYDKLTSGIAVVRSASLAVSVASLAATAFDVDKRAVLSMPPCRHLRPVLKSLAVQAATFAYHVAEVSGLLVLIPLIQATRPLGVYVLAGACFVLAASVLYFGAQSVVGDWVWEGTDEELVTILNTSVEMSAMGQSIQATISGAAARVEDTHGEVQALELEARGDVISTPLLEFDESVTLPGILLHSETHRYMKLVPGTSATAGLARGLLVLVTAAPIYVLVNILGVMGRRFQLAVAALRPVLWLAAWSTLGYRAAVDEETYRMVTAPGVTAILAVALAGMVAYGPLALYQRSQGRWLHFRQFDEHGFAEPAEPGQAGAHTSDEDDGLVRYLSADWNSSVPQCRLEQFRRYRSSPV